MDVILNGWLSSKKSGFEIILGFHLPCNTDRKIQIKLVVAANRLAHSPDKLVGTGTQITFRAQSYLHLIFGVVDHRRLPFALVFGVFDLRAFPLSAAGRWLARRVGHHGRLPLSVHVLVPVARFLRVRVRHQLRLVVQPALRLHRVRVLDLLRFRLVPTKQKSIPSSSF